MLKKYLTKIITTAIIVAGTVFVAGCGGDEGPESEGVKQNADGEEEEEPDPGEAKPEDDGGESTGGEEEGEEGEE